MKETIYLEVMTIVHGLSELCLCSSIKSNLRLKHEIISRDKGRTSIQVTSLMDRLGGRDLSTYRGFIGEYPDVRRIKGGLDQFTLFTIMDLDDCTCEMANRYKSKELFRGHWLYDHIIPIYNEPNFESTMRELKIEIDKKKDYIKIFPTNHGDLDLAKAKDLLVKLRSCKSSNLYLYVERCISLVERKLLID